MRNCSVTLKRDVNTLQPLYLANFIEEKEKNNSVIFIYVIYYSVQTNFGSFAYLLNQQINFDK